MPMLDKKVIQDLKTAFKELKDEVVIKFFTQETECQFCKETKGLLQELAEITDKIKLEVFDFVKDKTEADQYGIDKIPATVILGDRYRGIRFYGIPAGYEFGTLVEAVKLVSMGKIDLNDESRSFLDELDRDIHLQVFVTPTCPYCAGAVVLAHQLAYYSDRITADMVEATEFPHLTQKYGVMGVPKTVINETVFQEGAAPEKQIIEKIKEVK
jgi:glutaredoxin-like protein